MYVYVKGVGYGTEFRDFPFLVFLLDGERRRSFPPCAGPWPPNIEQSDGFRPCRE